MGAAGGLARRQKALEEEPVGREPSDYERGQRRRGSGDGSHPVSGRLGFAHQPVAGIGDQRRAGVGDERDRPAGLQLREQSRPHDAGVMLVIGEKRPRDGVSGEELAGHPCVFAGDEVGGGERFERA